MLRALEKQLVSFDGTRLGYRIYGESGPWLVLINGLGSTYDSWEELLPLLLRRWRVLSWDYRGLYGSAVPGDLQRLTVADHCRDLELLLEAEQIQQPVVGGWSMGVQIALESYRRLAGRIQGLILIHGTFGRFFSACIPLPGTALLVPPLLRLARAASPLISSTVGPLVRHRRFPTLAHRLGVTATDSPLIGRAAAHFAEVDWDIYLRIAGGMQSHDAAQLLPLIDVPVLVIGGGRDVMAPRPVIEQLARRIPGAELFYLPRATHYGQLEYPELVSRRMARFLDAHFPERLQTGSSENIEVSRARSASSAPARRQQVQVSPPAAA